MAPEAKVLRDVLKILNQMKAAGSPVWWVKVAGGPRQRRGLPDLHITLNGCSIWVELKAPGEEATPLQASMIRKINEAGGKAMVVHSVEEFRLAIQR